jgi:hypothetical protein
LRMALPDFRTLTIEEFLDTYETRPASLDKHSA